MSPKKMYSQYTNFMEKQDAQVRNDKKMSEMCGYTEKAIRRKIEHGIFIEGIHYIKAPDGRIHFDLDEYEKWLKHESKIPA